MASHDSSEVRFAAYVAALVGVIGHADRATPLRDDCTGLEGAAQTTLTSYTAQRSSLMREQHNILITQNEPFRADPSPHSGCDALLLLAYGVRVDCRRGELGMPEPLLHHVEGDAPADSLD